MTILRCAKCGAKRDTRNHSTAKDPKHATKQWLRRRCSEGRIPFDKKCTIVPWRASLPVNEERSDEGDQQGTGEA
jgi:hypothetical protein